ncbi:hypothetical protein C8Z91_11295 [Paenibacillus elgii]|uniref:Uncharacterized protein n=1 Tax=Paenibacillus elgii TaxID=189691 RepID=A0A2T6G4G8_9BACL|nr:hypothetical protein [Paenibacillus elgii]PUA39051.1 hypothetical protein C8Z91_11295 [Paenibacillus elgii]
MKRKITSVILSTALVCSFSTSVLASSSTENRDIYAQTAEQEGITLIPAKQYITMEASHRNVLKNSQLDEVVKAYGGTIEKLDLKSLPKGTPVIKVDNAQELDALVASIRFETEKALNQKIVLTPPSDSSNIANLTTAQFGETKTGTKQTVMFTAPTYSLNLISNYVQKHEADGSWAGVWKIIDVNTSTALSGFTLGINWTQTSAKPTKINDQKWVSTASGTLSFNLIINGIGQLVSMPVNGSHDVEI